MIIAFLKQVNILLICFLFCWLVKPDILVRLLNKEPYLDFHSWADTFSISIFCSLFLSRPNFFDIAISFFFSRDDWFVDLLAILITWLGVPCRILFCFLD